MPLTPLLRYTSIPMPIQSRNVSFIFGSSPPACACHTPPQPACLPSAATAATTATRGVAFPARHYASFSTTPASPISDVAHSSDIPAPHLRFGQHTTWTGLERTGGHHYHAVAHNIPVVWFMYRALPTFHRFHFARTRVCRTRGLFLPCPPFAYDAPACPVGMHRTVTCVTAG